MAYANPNYDPVKAHEYYMKHRKLKGDRSTKGMSDEQKEMLKFGKQQLTEQRRANMKKITEDAKSERQAMTEHYRNKARTFKEKRQEIIANIRETANAKKAKLKEEMQDKIESLKAQMELMTPEQKEIFKNQLKGTIQSLRATLTRQKGTIDAQTLADVAHQKGLISSHNEDMRNLTQLGAAGIKKDTEQKRQKEWEDYEKAVDAWYATVRAKK